MDISLTFNVNYLWVLWRHAQMNDMNDEPAWGLNFEPPTSYKVKFLPTEQTRLAARRSKVVRDGKIEVMN